MSFSVNNLPGEQKYAQLSVGICHYRIDGPDIGETLLLLHGATVSGWIFDRLRPYLNQAGFKTLTVDLMGHGYSERLDSVYDVNLFKQQIIELLDLISLKPTEFNSLDVDSPMHIFGHSLGAAIAASLINDYPARFNHIILTAPLVNFTANVPMVKLFKIPLLGELLNRTYVIPMLKRRRRKRYSFIDDGRFVNKFMSQFLLPGFEKTVLALFRSGVLEEQTEGYYHLGQLNHPCLVLRGSEDELVTAEQIAHLKTLLPKAVFKELKNTGHVFILSNPNLVADEIIRFINNSV
ncbi:alpha/beta fold hydrolase [Aliikangiella sp. IMCC44359]|uniref:alpha/beta fold hydrolase n=1 Tax=Aliikangiella sp. IMCC44359 TaxID=3459125 RepID=UPI00403AF432